uniref:(northern house mosquito) hypothetical protein n=1 Tax=Culex pipiens TaxID=7175 RepID=A0A8D8MQY2_CULPI
MPDRKDGKVTKRLRLIPARLPFCSQPNSSPSFQSPPDCTGHNLDQDHQVGPQPGRSRLSNPQEEASKKKNDYDENITISSICNATKRAEKARKKRVTGKCTYKSHP